MRHGSAGNVALCDPAHALSSTSDSMTTWRRRIAAAEAYKELSKGAAPLRALLTGIKMAASALCAVV